MAELFLKLEDSSTEEENPFSNGRRITLKAARELINRHQQDTHKGEGEKLHSLFIKKTLLKELIEDENCAYVRLFVGKKASISTLHTIVIVGADKNGQNLIADSSDLETTAHNKIYDDLGHCPSNCHGNGGRTL